MWLKKLMIPECELLKKTVCSKEEYSLEISLNLRILSWRIVFTTSPTYSLNQLWSVSFWFTFIQERRKKGRMLKDPCREKQPVRNKSQKNIDAHACCSRTNLLFAFGTSARATLWEIGWKIFRNKDPILYFRHLPPPSHSKNCTMKLH